MLSIDDRGPAPPCPAPFNLAAYVLAGGAGDPDRPALIRIVADGVTSLSHAQLSRAVLAMAGSLAARNLPRGARVLLRLGNTPDFPVAFLAAAAVDLVPVVVSSLLTEPEVARVVQATRPDLVIAEPALPLGPMDCPVLDCAALTANGAAPLTAPFAGDPDRPGFIVFTSVHQPNRGPWSTRIARYGHGG